MTNSGTFSPGRAARSRVWTRERIRRGRADRRWQSWWFPGRRPRCARVGRPDSRARRRCHALEIPTIRTPITIALGHRHSWHGRDGRVSFCKTVLEMENLQTANNPNGNAASGQSGRESPEKYPAENNGEVWRNRREQGHCLASRDSLGRCQMIKTRANAR